MRLCTCVGLCGCVPLCLRVCVSVSLRPCVPVSGRLLCVCVCLCASGRLCLCARACYTSVLASIWLCLRVCLRLCVTGPSVCLALSVRAINRFMGTGSKQAIRSCTNTGTGCVLVSRGRRQKRLALKCSELLVRKQSKKEGCLKEPQPLRFAQLVYGCCLCSRAEAWYISPLWNHNMGLEAALKTGMTLAYIPAFISHRLHIALHRRCSSPLQI